MRILHTSDWHLGRTFHGHVLDDAHEAFADHLVALVEAERVDAVVISGDVYDRAIPPTHSVHLLYDTLRRLTDRTRVVLTPGNHDSAPRLGFGASLYREALSVRAEVATVDAPVLIPHADGDPGLLIYALPYLEPHSARTELPPLLAERLGESVVEPCCHTDVDADSGGDLAHHTSCQPSEADAAGTSLGDEAAQAAPALPCSHEAVVSGALRLVARDLAERRRASHTRVPALAMAHAFVVGGLASEDSERDIRVGGVDSVPSEVFSTLGGSPMAEASGGLDYVALGHLHRPQEISLPRRESRRTEEASDRGLRLVYSGSPVALSFSEAPWAKSTVLVDFDADGVRECQRIPAPVLHRVVTVRGTMEELESDAFDDAVGAWVRAIVRGPTLPGIPARLRARFGEVLAITYEDVAQPALPHRTITRSSDPLAVTEDFVRALTHTELDAAHRQVLRTAYDATLAAARSEA